jgi:hypothetical protein
MNAKQPAGHDKLATWARAYWRGELPLWGQFWLWGMVVGTLVGVAMTLLTIPLFRQIQITWLMEDYAEALLQAYLLLLLFGAWLTYYTWHIVSVWRCAAAEHPLLRWAARFFVVLVTLTFWSLYAEVALTGAV